VPGQAGQGPASPTGRQRPGSGCVRRPSRRRGRRRPRVDRGATGGQRSDGGRRLAERCPAEERRTPRGVKVDRARALALDALIRIEEEDAFANLLLPAMLDRSKLPARDRAFVTELVYGTVRMRRACDWLIDRFVNRELDTTTR